MKAKEHRPRSQVRYDFDVGTIKNESIRRVENKVHEVCTLLYHQVSDGLYKKLDNLFWYI